VLIPGKARLALEIHHDVHGINRIGVAEILIKVYNMDIPVLICCSYSTNAGSVSRYTTTRAITWHTPR
jgi:hypothetical protein